MRKNYLKIIVFLLLVALALTLFFVFKKEGYSNIHLLQMNPNSDSEMIESSDYYHLDDKYIQGNYPQNPKIHFMTYDNDTPPVWAKIFKWC